MSEKVSVIIPVCNEFPQIAFTLDSISQNLRGLDHEILVVFNNNSDEAPEYLKGRGRHIKLLTSESFSCWQARNLGAAEASGDYFFFFDAHILLEPEAIAKAVAVLKTEREAGIVWFAMRYLMDTERILYGYRLKPDKFWGNWTSHRRTQKPYPLAMSGAAGMGIKAETYRAIGGWLPSFGIYGGGEPYLSLKAERLGYRNYISPDSIFAHFSAKRGYCWNNDDLWRNFLMAAFATGGAKWLERLKSHYAEKCNGVPRYLARLDELAKEAEELATDDHLWIESQASFTLDEVIARDINNTEKAKP